MSGYVPKEEPAEGPEALPNGPSKAGRAMPLQDISRHANLQSSSDTNQAAKRKREGEGDGSQAGAQPLGADD